MSLKVVHIAITPLAGSPIRIVSALNRTGRWQARLVTFNPQAYGNRIFENDLDWSKSKAEATEIISQADIIHLHHFFDLRQNQFEIDFKRVAARARFVQQFHSTAKLACEQAGLTRDAVINSEIPQLVIAQYPERYYPRARIVPNLCPAWTTTRPRNEGTRIRVFFGPSRAESAWSSGNGEARWDTKGAPETRKLLALLEKKKPEVESVVITGRPHAECMEIKSGCQAAIDDLVTGSYHLAGLEAISQGLCCLTYLDQRTERVLKTITGANETPFLNVRLEEASDVLESLVDQPAVIQELGERSKAWFGKYYDEANLVKHYENAYMDLINRPGSFNQIRPEFNNACDQWMMTEFEDARFRSRRRNRMGFSMRLRETFLGESHAINP